MYTQIVLEIVIFVNSFAKWYCNFLKRKWKRILKNLESQLREMLIISLYQIVITVKNSHAVSHNYYKHKRTYNY